MQMINKVVITVHLNLLAHFEIMINNKVELSFELFLVQLRFLSHKSFVPHIGHVVDFGKILILHELLSDSMLNFL